MRSFMQRITAAFFLITLATTLISCGGGGGSVDSTDANQLQGKGTVGILLTDKPADPDDFSAILASIVEIQLKGSGNNGDTILYSGPAKEFDLLRLRNESIPLAFKDNIPAGKYCKIRLILEKLELELADDTLPPNERYQYPHLPGNGKLDLVVRGCFDVVADEVLTLQVDIDAGNSFHIVETPSCKNNPNKSCFNFRPVIFVDVMTKHFNSKLVRLSGKITHIYSDSLLLCGAVPIQHMSNLGCVKIHFGKDSAFFDNDNNNGAPTSISKLLNDNNKGEDLTVVGWVKPWNNKDDDDDISAQHYPLLYLEALVAELGDFQQVEGKIETVNADNTTGFSMALSSGTGNKDVEYQPPLYPDRPGVNGTRIVSKSGKLLKPGEIERFLPVQVDGTSGNTSQLMAALVIVDKSALDTEQVTGVITWLGTNSLILSPDDDVCGATPSSLMVDLIDPLEILTVTMTEHVNVIVPGGILKVGQTVGMNGSCELTGYQTDNIVIVEN
jgi:hypothetical protein